MSRLRANQITNENANGAPNFPHGLTVTGIVTATTINQTPTSIVVGSAVTANSQGIDVTGVVTATSYRGNGSQLTGISVDPSATASSDGFLKVLNASTPQIRLNNDASDGATTRAFFGIATGSNNFINGSVANDTVLSGRVAGDLLIGVGSTIRLRIDELGRVTKPNNPCFCVMATANQAYSGGSIFVCNSPETTGVCHNIGGHFNTSTGVFTAPVAGRYYLSMDTAPQFLSSSPTDGWQITIQKNGVASELADSLFGGGSNGNEDHLRCDGILNLAAGDEIRWHMNGYGGSMNFVRTKFQGYLVG